MIDARHGVYSSFLYSFFVIKKPLLAFGLGRERYSTAEDGRHRVSLKLIQGEW